MQPKFFANQYRKKQSKRATFQCFFCIRFNLQPICRLIKDILGVYECYSSCYNIFELGNVLSTNRFDVELKQIFAWMSAQQIIPAKHGKLAFHTITLETNLFICEETSTNNNYIPIVIKLNLQKTSAWLQWDKYHTLLLVLVHVRIYCTNNVRDSAKVWEMLWGQYT